MQHLGFARRGVVLSLVMLLALAACDDGGSGAEPGDGAAATTIAGEPGSTPLAAYADYESINYADPARWLCRPDADDICQSDLDATVIEADGTLTVEPFEPAADPPIDCFYVYPTISRDETPVSDWEASPEEEGYAVLNQAARLRAACRLFAPVYRQATLTALVGRISGATPEVAPTNPYDDVLDAFRTYLAEDNEGRGFVLIGHSQGSGLLAQLIAAEIDPVPELREKLVAAYLAGWSVAVPEGADVGGQFQEVPLCRAPDQTGCVVTWASFRAESPPPDGAFFGRARDGRAAGCTNPAALGGGPSELHGYFPARRSASILSSLGTETSADPWVDPSVGTVETPFVSLPGLATGECVSTGAFTYLAVTVNPDPGPRADDIGGDLTPEWGLHLVDVSLVMGDIVELVRQQAAAYGAG